MLKFFKNYNLLPLSLKEHTTNYPTPYYINYFYGFGFMSGAFLGIQIFSGIFLAMYYVADSSVAFESVEIIVNEIYYG